MSNIRLINLNVAMLNVFLNRDRIELVSKILVLMTFEQNFKSTGTF